MASAVGDAEIPDTLPCCLSTALLSGGFAGCVGKTATAPLSRLTVLAQTASLLAVPGASSERQAFARGRQWEGLRHVVRHQGVLALWKGNLCTCIHWFPFTGVSFGIVEAIKHTCPWTVGGPGWCSFIPGAVAGGAAVFVCYPLEVVRTRLMAQGAQTPGRHVGIWGILRESIRLEGLGMYRGLGVSVAVAVPSVSVSFGLYAQLRQHFEACGLPATSFTATLLAGGFSGAAGSAVTFPLDVLRKRLQVMGMDGAGIPRRSWACEALHIWRTDGAPGFFRGFAPDLAKVFPTVAITFVAFEQLRDLIRPWG